MSLYKGILLWVALIAFIVGAFCTVVVFETPINYDVTHTDVAYLILDIRHFLDTQVHYFMFAIISFIIGGITAILYVLLEIKDSLKKGGEELVAILEMRED